MITISCSASNDRPSRYGADQLHPPNSHQGWTEERGPVMRPTAAGERQARAPRVPRALAVALAVVSPSAASTAESVRGLWKTTISSAVNDNRRTRYGADQLHPPNSHQGWTEERGPVKQPAVLKSKNRERR